MLAIPLTIAYIIFFVIIAMDPQQKDLILPMYLVGYVLALSTVIRAVHKLCLEWMSPAKWIVYVLFIVFGFFTMPIFLIVSIFGRLGRIFSIPEDEYDEGSAKARLARDVAEDIRQSMWFLSSTNAVEKILDENYRGIIRLDDGTKAQHMKQVAIIRLSGKKYVLLCPISMPDILDPDYRPGDEDNEAYMTPTDKKALAFAIAPCPGHPGNIALVPVENDNLYRRIYAVYDSLVAERDLYSPKEK